VKQVHRFLDGDIMDHDVIALDDEEVGGGRPLLEEVMREGHRIKPSDALDECRKRCTEALGRVPVRLRSLEPSTDPYRVENSSGLNALVERMRREDR